MFSNTPHHEGLAPDSPTDVRALPARASLAFERKQAKKLLQQLRRGDPEALARVAKRLRAAADRAAADFKLADAQFTIAREYGFPSWPRLVEYFTTLARHERSGHRRGEDRAFQENWARTILAEHAQKRSWTAQCLATFVPRFFGRSIADVFAAHVTIDDARLVAARLNRYPSWDAMIADSEVRDKWAMYQSPGRAASQAIRAADLAALQHIVEAHPEVLQQEFHGQPGMIALAHDAILHELRESTPGARMITEWLATQVDLSVTMNWMLLGSHHAKAADVQLLLDRGADPEWLPPNGITVLEHAIYRYWNGAAVDLIAARVEPPKAFWIAAGLGDVRAVEKYLAKDGMPTPAPRQRRPDFTAMGFAMPCLAAADDQTIVWEAFFVAALNQRFAVLDVLLDRGFPIDYAAWGAPILHIAVGNCLFSLVEYLVNHGADLEMKGWRPHASAREIAEEHFANRPDNTDARRILELCSDRDPEVVLRQHEERRAAQIIQTAPHVEAAFEFAKHDAVRLGHTAVAPENLFVGLLARGELPLLVLADAGVDIGRLRSALASRLEALESPPAADMTADAETTACLMAARADAERRKHGVLNVVHVLWGLLARNPRSVSELLEGAGGSPGKVRADLERILSSG